MKNRLDRIVTKSGDSGLTSINPSKRISKNSDVIHFLGNLDELNAHIGSLKADLLIKTSTENPMEDILSWIIRIQHRLFDIGGTVCSEKIDAFDEDEVSFLESVIKKINEQLPPLREFVLPGGSPLGAKAHVARTVCRRTERSLINLVENSPLYEKILKKATLPYLNRLSDFLFVLSRRLDQINQSDEQMWKASKKK